jgi:hypothetical protein
MGLHKNVLLKVHLIWCNSITAAPIKRDQASTILGYNTASIGNWSQF